MANLTNTIIDGTLQVNSNTNIGGNAVVTGNVSISGNITGNAINLTKTYQALGAKTADFTIDCSLGDIISFTVGAALTLTVTASASNVKCREIKLVITNGGAYTLTWPASVKWVADTAPTLTASGIDIITLLTIDNGTTWFGLVNGLNFA